MIQLLLAILILIVGIALIIYSSMKAVKHSAILAAVLGVSPLIIGVTLVSIGTDISEIFNSLMSCALGHSDIDVGDSVGSNLTQLTLVFGILPLVAGMFYIHRRDIIILGGCEILSLTLIFTIVEKGYITRFNGILLVGSLGIYIWLIYNANKESIIERVEMIEKIEEVISCTPANVAIFCASYEILKDLVLNGLEDIVKVHEKTLYIEEPEMSGSENAILLKKYKRCV